MSSPNSYLSIVLALFQTARTGASEVVLAKVMLFTAPQSSPYAPLVARGPAGALPVSQPATFKHKFSADEDDRLHRCDFVRTRSKASRRAKVARAPSPRQR